MTAAKLTGDGTVSDVMPVISIIPKSMSSVSMEKIVSFRLLSYTRITVAVFCCPVFRFNVMDAVLLPKS